MNQSRFMLLLCLASSEIVASQKESSKPLLAQVQQTLYHIQQLNSYPSLSKLLILPIFSAACFYCGNLMKPLISKELIFLFPTFFHPILATLQKTLSSTYAAHTQVFFIATGYVVFLLYLKYLFSRLKRAQVDFIDLQEQYEQKLEAIENFAVDLSDTHENTKHHLVRMASTVQARPPQVS